MNWDKIKEFYDCTGIPLESFCELISKNLLVFCDSNSLLSIYNTENLTKIKFANGIDYNIRVFNDKLYFIKEKVLYNLDIDLLSYNIVYEAKEENLYLINELFCKDFTSKRNPRTFINKIIDLKKKTSVYYWTDDKVLISIISGNLLFNTKFNGDIFSINILTGIKNWHIDFDKGIAGRRYYQELTNNECIFQRYYEVNNNSLVKLNLQNGEIIWELVKTFHFYNYNESGNQLYGLGGKTFEVINAETGERELQKELNINLHVVAHLTYYADGYLYFSGHIDNNIPVFGAVDVATGELVFTQEVEIPGERSFRKGLDRPVVVGNRLYVRDSMKTLHIFERE